MRKDFETRLTVDDVTVTERDVEMLRAIDRHGSMHRAAEKLGRSYPHLQRRVVELEEAVGELTERRRGGSDGGGTELTETATELLRRFDRHRTELAGVATVTESILEGTVQDRTGELATVETPAGPVVALVPAGAAEVEVSVRSDAVVLSDPGETPGSGGTSFRNRFEAVVTAVESGEAVANVALELDGGVSLEALVTTGSRDALALEPGRAVVASFKATAARGIGVDRVEE